MIDPSMSSNKFSFISRKIYVCRIKAPLDAATGKIKVHFFCGKSFFDVFRRH